MGWLGNWHYRRKITIDATKIDADLTHFPILVYLSASSGSGADDVTDIFTELGANRKKIAFTKDDGTTELYAEIEQWDNANSKAWIWVSKSDLVLDDTVDTDIFIYYDSLQADNANIGDIDEAVSANVWDANFRFVHHLVDATTSTVKDSTSNNDDGIKLAANKPLGVAGKISKGQDFETTTTDYIALTNTITDTNTFTTSAWVKRESTGAIYQNILSNYNSTGPKGFIFIFWGAAGANQDKMGFSTNDVWYYANTAINTDWHHVSVSINATNGIQFYLDGATDSALIAGGATIASNIATRIGRQGLSDNYFDGIIDEARYSHVTRPAAWIKAEYNAGIDALIKGYAAAESLPTEINIADSGTGTDSVSVVGIVDQIDSGTGTDSVSILAFTGETHISVFDVIPLGSGSVSTGFEANWATAHALDPGVAHSHNTYSTGCQNSGTDRKIERSFLSFDTSPLPNNYIASAIIQMGYCASNDNNDNDGKNYLVLVKSLQTDKTDLANADFAKCGDAVTNPTELSNRISLNDVVVGNTVTFTLNAAGLALIYIAGNTAFGLREGHDTENHETVAISSAVFTNNAGATYYSRLSVEYYDELFDEGEGIDEVGILAIVDIADSGTGTDSIGITALIPETDSGAGTDSISILGSIPETDSGTGSESIGITAILPTGTDSGAGSDSVSVVEIFPIPADDFDLIIENCTINNNAGMGVTCLKGSNVDIINTQIMNNGSDGVWVCGDASNSCWYINVVDCNIRENRRGILTSFASPLNIQGNIIERNKLEGISLLNATSMTRIVNNSILDNSQNPLGTYYGIELLTNIHYSKILNNHIIGLSQKYGILIGAGCQYNEIGSNYLRGNLLGGYADFGTNTFIGTNDPLVDTNIT